jgi:hypothetical protein
VTSPSATKRLSVAILAFVIASLSLLVLADTASSQTAESFRDDFTSISYSGNNGTMNWSGSWQESGESNGPTSGSVQVTASDRCFGGSGTCLRIGSEGGNLTNHGASRSANLGDAVSATLSFNYRRQTQGQVSGSVTVQVSGNGGSSWATLATINFAGPQKASSATFNISAHMGSNTKVRFRGTGTGVNGYLHFDTIEITADIVPPTTTTTVVTTTLPGTPTTTTTTSPGSSTTSTFPGTPTTTVPGSPSTPTVPGAPTTTIGGLPTTTAIEGTPTTTTPGTSTTTVPGSPTTSTATSTSEGTAPPTASPTDSDTTPSDSPGQVATSDTQTLGESLAAVPTGDDLAPMVIAVETVSANAVTIAILALLASGLAFAGIDRAKPKPTPDADIETEPPTNNK